MPRAPSPSPSPSPPKHRTSPSRARSYMSSRARSRTPSQSRSPSRSKRSVSKRPFSSCRSFSSDASSRRSRSTSSRRGPSQQEKNHNKGKLIKDSAGLLLGIGVAAVVAHIFWPKGMIYGDKEDWEKKVEKEVEKVKDTVKDTVKDKVKDKVLGDEGDDDGGERYQDRHHYPPREMDLRVRSRDGRYYYAERAQGPPVRCRSLQAQDRAMRPLRHEHAQTRVYEQVEVARRERRPRNEWARERMASSWEHPRGRYYSHQGGEPAACPDDQFVVVEEHESRRGRRAYR